MKRRTKRTRKRRSEPLDFNRVIDSLERILRVIFYGYIAVAAAYFYWLYLQKM